MPTHPDAVTGVPGSPYAQKFQKTCSQVYSLRRRSSVPPSRRLSVPAQMQILLLFHAFHNVFIIPYCPAVVKGFFCKKSGQPLDKAKEIVYNRNRKSIPVDGLLPISVFVKIAALCGSGAVIFMPAKTRLTQRSSGAIIKAYGALAQLVARHIRIVKARGSTPLCSTRTILHKPLLLCR